MNFFYLFSITLWVTTITLFVGCGASSENTTESTPAYVIDPNDPNATTIYPAAVIHAAASPIASSVITDVLERQRWSSNVPLSAGHHEFWVAPDVPVGTGSGTEADPWDLYTTFEGLSYSGGPVPPNSIVWMKEGDYISPKANPTDRQRDLDGEDLPLWPIRRMQGDTAANQAIHFRPEAGAKVRLDGGIKFDDAWPADGVWLWDFDMTTIAAAHTEGNYTFPKDDYRPQPDYFIPVGEGYGGTVEFYIDIEQWLLDHHSYGRPAAAIHGGSGHALINTLSYRIGGGYYSWGSPQNALVYGCTAHDVGYLAEDRPHGPGIYAQNLSGTPRLYAENLLVGCFSNPFQIYSRTQGGAALGSMYGEGNIAFGARRIGDGPNSSNPIQMVIFGDEDGANQHFTDNYIYGATLRTSAYDAADNQFDDNFIIYSRTDSCVACSQPTNYVEEHLSITKIDLRPNRYDPRRANLVIMNGARDPVIAVNLGSWASEGDHIAVYSAGDLTTDSLPVAEGVYNGSYVNIPMNGYLDASWEYVPPVSWALEQNPKDTLVGDYSTVDREFWAFILIKNP